MPKKKTFLAGHVGVDAGMVMIGDPGYIIDPSGSKEPMDWDDFCETIEDGEHKAFESEIPDVATEPLGKFQGIVIPSGYGDGIYPVYVTLDSNGTPESASIIFK